MKKAITATLLMLVASMVQAKSTDSQANDTPPVSFGIITPNVSTGMMFTSIFAHNTSGDMVVCQSPNEYNQRANHCNVPDQSARVQNTGWVPIQNVVPKGRQYVGYRVVHRSSYSSVLEIYWK